MKRFTLPLLAAAFLVGCGPSRMPTDYAGSTSGSGTGGATDLNLLGSGAAGAAAQAAR